MAPLVRRVCDTRAPCLGAVTSLGCGGKSGKTSKWLPTVRSAARIPSSPLVPRAGESGLVGARRAILLQIRSVTKFL